MPKLSEHLASLGQPVVVYPKMVKFLGSWPAAAFVAHLTWWEGKGEAIHWIYKTREELLEELGLSRDQQQLLRAKLRKRGYLIEERRGVPCRIYYRLDWDALNRDWEEFVANGCQLTANPTTDDLDVEQPAEAEEVADSSQLAANPSSSRRETRQLDDGKSAILMTENPPSRTGEETERKAEGESKTPPSASSVVSEKQDRANRLLMDTRKRILEKTEGKQRKRRRQAKVISLDEVRPDVRVVMEEFWTGWKVMYGNYPPGWFAKEVAQAELLAKRVGGPVVAAKLVRYFFVNWTQLKDKWRWNGSPTIGLMLARGPALVEEAIGQRAEAKKILMGNVETVRFGS